MSCALQPADLVHAVDACEGLNAMEAQRESLACGAAWWRRSRAWLREG